MRTRKGARMLVAAGALGGAFAVAASPLPAASRAAPDLSVQSISEPPALLAASLRPSATVRNSGNRRAGRSVLRWYLSMDARKDARDVRLGARSVKPLATRGSARPTATLAVPARLVPGKYRLIACADDTRKVRERNERNNCRASRRTTTRSPLPAPTPPAPAPTPPVPVPPPSPFPTIEPLAPDTVAPDTEITGGPDGVTTATVATITFTASEAGATFRCVIDGAAFENCASPLQLTGLAADAAHTVEVAASDAAGNVDATPARRTWRIEPPAPQPPGAPQDPAPADPATLASAPSTGDVTDFAAGFSFLYEGPGAIQTDATIAAGLASVIRGRVINRMGAPVVGARVSAVGHPEFGRTATRGDGRFDMVVEGGAAVAVDIARAGYLPVQRTVTPRAGDWVEFDEEVVLVPYDIEATAVDPGLSSVQTVRASRIDDASGERQATLLFESGTDAEMRMPDGTTQPLDELTVRATEYTAGATGEQAMPGTLPASSAYTYAVELSVDEAVQAGAAGVEFDKPVMVYLENFLDMPAGTHVPSGSYDRAAGHWVPESDGRVVTIVGESDGSALVDVTGDGVADDGASLGLDAAEKARLASLYDTGDSLWRIPVTHFSAWDFNWPAGPPAGATGPNGAPPAGPPPDCESGAAGSYIGCETQVLGEDVSLAGVTGGLHYRSSRLRPREGGSRVTLNLTGATVPSGLERVEMTAYVAGRRYEHTVTNPSPGLTHDVVWDGKDAYGRDVQGEQPLTAEVRYVYAPRYYETREEFDASFASVAGIPIMGSKSRGEISLSRFYRTAIGGWDARATGLGGWTLGIHHAYDPGGRRLHLGDGSTRSAAGLNLRTLRTVAGTGESIFNGDDIPAVQANLYSPSGAATAPDGTVFIADGRHSRIRRVGADGQITTVAGTGTEGFSGDGGPATAAQIGRPAGMDFGPDGALYFADPSNHRIRRIRDGVMETVAGGGGSLGDGGPATAAQVIAPRDVALAPDGTIYIAETGRDRLRMVTPGGTITTAAGAGFSEPPGIPATASRLHFPEGIDVAHDGSVLIAESDSDRVTRLLPNGILDIAAGGGPVGSPVPGDGGPATATRLGGPYDVAAEPDGSFHLVEKDGEAVRHVDAAGVITTVAGTRLGGGSSADGRPAPSTRLQEPVAIDRSPDGSLLVVERFGAKVRRIASPLPGVSAGDVLVPSADSTEVFRFSRAGRHLDTRDAYTAALRWSFAYDTAGRLVSATDGDGLTTTVERNAGVATAIVGPGGQRTDLVIADGMLTSIEDPTGRTHAMTYTEGLLGSFARPGTPASTFGYDGARRLISDTDPLGGEQTLAREETAGGWKVTRTTPLGRATVYEVERKSDGATVRTRTSPSGAVSRTEVASSGNSTTTLPDGSTVTATVVGDPRFGLLAPVSSQVMTTPGGLSRTVTQARSATLATPGDPFSLQTLQEDVVINGRLRRRAFNAATDTFTDVGPEGVTATTRLDAKGRLAGHRPAAGTLEETFAYDSRGRLSGIARGTQTYTLGYDSADAVETITDATGAQTAFARDAAGRLTASTTPEARAYAFTYDARGDLASLTAPGGAVTDVDSDLLGRVTRYVPAGSTAGYEADFDADRALASNALPGGRTIVSAFDTAGRRATSTTPEGTVAFSYDGMTDRPATATATGDGTARTFTFDYDGFLTTSMAASGATTGTSAHTYDSTFREITRVLTAESDTVTRTFTYDNDDQPTAIGPFAVTRGALARLPSQMSDGTATFGFTSTTALRPGGRSLTVAGNPVQTLSLTYDAAGRVATRAETLLGASHSDTVGYDDDGQVISITRDGSLQESYLHDPRGNRVSRAIGVASPETSTFDAQDRILTHGGVPYTVNADGFLVARGADTFSYGTRGELRSATVGGEVVSYAYDALGRRATRTAAGQTTRYFYANPRDPLELSASRGSDDTLTAYDYDETGILISLVRGGVRYYVASDTTGTPRAVVTATGAPVRVLSYDAFGRVLSDSAPGFALEVGFAGGIADPLTGLVRLGLRDYDPRTGRWTARDPLMLAAGDANLYRYSGNDPVGRLDRGGLTDTAAPVKKIPRNRPDGRPYAIERYAQPSFNCREPGSAGEWFACTTNGGDRITGGGIGRDKLESGEAAFALATVFMEIGERIIDSCFPTPPNPPAPEIDPKLRQAFNAGRPPNVPPEFRRR